MQINQPKFQLVRLRRIAWKAYVKENNLTGYQWNELRKGKEALASRYRVNAIPCFVLINPSGERIGRWIGYSENSLINRLNTWVAK